MLSIGLCVGELFFLSLGEKWGIYHCRVFKGLTGRLKIWHTVGDTVLYFKYSNFKYVVLSGPAVVLGNLSQQVIVGMNVLRVNYLILT